MFTGLIEEVGRVAAATPFENGRRFRIEASTVLEGLALGDSIAVDGVCQTVVALHAGAFDVEAIETTLGRTTLAALEVGDAVNLERPVAAGGRLGGHFVQGHVDGVGTVISVERRGEHVLLDVEVPDVVREVTVLHGSIAVQGVSLTVNDVDELAAKVQHFLSRPAERSTIAENGRRTVEAEHSWDHRIRDILAYHESRT